MSDSEKPLKVISGIVSGLLVVSALLFLIFSLGKPKEAEAVLEYSASSSSDYSTLTKALYELRKDQSFLVEVATRSKFAQASDSDLPEIAAKLGTRLTFKANPRESSVSIHFAHPKATTAIDVTNAAAAVAKERLEAQQQKLRMDILVQEDAVEDKRKLLEIVLRKEANNAADPQNEEAYACRPRPPPPSIDVKADYEHALRKLEELKAEPAFSIGSIRAAKLTSD